MAWVMARRFSSSVAVSPANRAERGPGLPPSASTSIPESSAIEGSPSAAETACAFRSAFSRYVSPVSSTSGQGPSWSWIVSHVTGQSAQIRPSSRSLWSLRVAIAIRGGSGIRTSGAERFVLDLRELRDAGSRQIEQRVQVVPRERRTLGGPLDLDEVARPRHHDGEVQIRAGVLLVAQVQPRLTVDDPHRDGGHAVDEDIVGDHAALGQSAERDRQRDVAAGDGRGARAGVRLQHVTVDRDRPLPQLREIGHGTERAPDQPLDLLGASAWTSLV